MAGLGFLGRREETNPASFSARELAAEASSG
jgi:hypothetical protein